MTDQEMEALVIEMLGEPRFDALAPTYLALAESAIVARMFPFRDDASWADVPERYGHLACEIAVYLIGRRGAEGETQHSESGALHGYESAGIPDSYLRQIVPRAAVPL